MVAAGPVGMMTRAGGPTNFYGSRRHKGASVFSCFAVGTLAANGTAYATDPWTAQWPDFESSMPASLRSSAKTAGCTTIRFAIDPSPFLLANAAGDTARFTALLAKPLAALDVLTGSFAVIWDMHVRPDPNQITGQGTSDAEIVQSNAAVVNYGATCAKIAAILQARYSPGQIAFEMFNEPPFGQVFTGALWPVIANQIYTAIRAKAPTITILVSGDSYAGIGNAANQDYSGQTASGLCAFNSSNAAAMLADPNVMWVVHVYDPLQVTFQSEDGQGYNGGNGVISGLSFEPPANGTPAQTAAYNAALASATANANADKAAGVKTAAQTTAIISAVTTDLRAYFGMDSGVPMNAAWLISSPKLFARVASWADANGIKRGRIFVTEYGCDDGTVNGFQGRPGASKPTKLAYLQAIGAAIDSYGFSRMLWALQGLWSGIRITDADNNMDLDFAAAAFAPS